MPNIFVALCLPFLLLILVLALIKSRKNSTYNIPPGPPKLPIIGNLHQLGQNVHQSLHKLSQQHGPIMHLKLARVPTVVVSAPELAKQVLKTHDLQCCSRPPLVAFDKLSYGFSDVACAPYGEKWKENRRICVEELFNNKKVFSAHFKSVREQEVELTLRVIASFSLGSLPINLSEALTLLTSNVVCRISFGKSFANDLGEFHETFKEAQAMLGGLFMADYLPVIGWIIDVISGMHGRLERTFEKFDQFSQRLIDDRLHGAIKNHGDYKDILDVLLHMQMDNKNVSYECIKALLMDILIAGTDTSAAIEVWAMTELMRHPTLMKKAQDEVRSCIRNKRMVEESDLDKLHYLKLVIKETMRKHPPVPLLVPRETMQHIKLNGYDIPRKTRLIVNAWAIARDPNLWEKPEEFNPERFSEHKEYEFELIPFGEGRRICPGKNLGLVMIELVLANLLYCFNWDLPYEMTIKDVNLDEAPGVTVHKKSPLWLVPSVYEGI